MKETGLKPCPFCGGKATLMNAARLFENRNRYFVTCLVCGVETPRIARTAKEAITAWERRADHERRKTN